MVELSQKPFCAMKRCYKHVLVKASREGKAWEIYLDQRLLKSPARHSLSFQEKALAEAIATEWDSQGDSIDPQTMPLMSGGTPKHAAIRPKSIMAGCVSGRTTRRP